MPLRDWTLTNDAAYHKAQAAIDEIIMTALASGPAKSYDLMELLRAAGYGNAINDNPLELAYSMTGAIYRSAKNSLRSRGLIRDSWDEYMQSGKKDFQVIYPANLFKATEPAPMQEATHA